MRVRQRAKVLVMALAVSMSVVALPGTALAGTCGNTEKVRLWGAGEAHWTLSCNADRTRIYINGWVKDTDKDGQCIEVYAFFPKGGGSPTVIGKDCGADGDTKHFNADGPGDRAEVRVREVG